MKKNLILLFLCGLLISCGSSCKKNDDAAPTTPESPAPAPTSTFTVTPTSTPCPAGSFGEPVTNTTANLNTNATNATSFVLTSSVAVTALSAAFMGDETFRLGIYTDNAGTPQNLLVATVPTAATTGWNTVAVGPVTLTAGTYWLALTNTANPSGDTNYSNNTTGSFSYCTCDFANPWVAAGSFGSYHMSIQAHYLSCP